MLGNLKYAPGILTKKECILNNIKMNSSLVAANIEVKEGINMPISAKLKPEAVMIAE